jgi:hypothetical protein
MGRRAKPKIDFDRALSDLPQPLRWREYMMRVEAVIFAASAAAHRGWRPETDDLGTMILAYPVVTHSHAGGVTAPTYAELYSGAWKHPTSWGCG